MRADSLHDTLVTTAPGLELVTVSELQTLGVTPSAAIERGAVPLRASLETIYALNLNLRTASRITLDVDSFRARTFAELERKSQRIPWEEWMRDDMRVALRVTCRKSRLYHSDAVAERVAAAITARTKAHIRIVAPSDESPLDAQLFIVRLVRDECSIRADSSGEHLHRRGYRQAVAKAPLRETLAAAMLLAAGWDTTSPLIDPFCGSGTIAIEGAMLARHIAPGSRRSFAFMRWPTFDAARWSSLLDRALERETSVPRAGPIPLISAYDRDTGAVAAARENATRAGVADDITFGVQALSALQVPRASGWLVTNPPYGERVGDPARLRDLYAALGRIAREQLAGWHVALLSAHPALEAQLGVPIRESFRTSNGGINVRLVCAVPS